MVEHDVLRMLHGLLPTQCGVVVSTLPKLFCETMFNRAGSRALQSNEECAYSQEEPISMCSSPVPISSVIVQAVSSNQGMGGLFIPVWTFFSEQDTDLFPCPDLQHTLEQFVSEAAVHHRSGDHQSEEMHEEETSMMTEEAQTVVGEKGSGSGITSQRPDRSRECTSQVGDPSCHEPFCGLRNSFCIPDVVSMLTICQRELEKILSPEHEVCFLSSPVFCLHFEVGECHLFPLAWNSVPLPLFFGCIICIICMDDCMDLRVERCMHASCVCMCVRASVQACTGDSCVYALLRLFVAERGVGRGLSALLLRCVPFLVSWECS